jgi:hypothetical protein
MTRLHGGCLFFLLPSGRMMSEERITAGKTYWVHVDKTKFKVRAVRPAAIPGWWHCEGEDARDPVVIPEDKLLPAEEE